MKSLVTRAAEFAAVMHDGQTRADGSEYIWHPRRVAAMVASLPIRHVETPVTPAMIAATWLHDVYEDTDLEPPFLSKRFGFRVGSVVEELTNKYTAKAYPSYNRKDRKELELIRLAESSPQAQTIKLCDRLDNLLTIKDKGAGFAKLYCDESEALVNALYVSPWLKDQVLEVIERVRNES